LVISNQDVGPEAQRGAFNTSHSDSAAVSELMVTYGRPKAAGGCVGGAIDACFAICSISFSLCVAELTATCHARHPWSSWRLPFIRQRLSLSLSLSVCVFAWLRPNSSVWRSQKPVIRRIQNSRASKCTDWRVEISLTFLADPVSKYEHVYLPWQGGNRN